jgi:histidine triad (HIT) family protein
MENEKTLFEKIMAKEVPAEIVYEDEHTLAFLDIRPVAPGHTLVICKQPHRNALQTPDEELAHIMSTVKKVANAQMEVLGAEGINIIFNNEAAAGQVVFHTHGHVIPRSHNDGLAGWPQHEYKDDANMKETAEKLRAKLA